MTLTNREIEVASLIAEGLTNPQIAERLKISTSTVDNHRTSIYRKLRVHNAAALIHRLYQAGVLQMRRPRGRPKKITG